MLIFSSSVSWDEAYRGRESREPMAQHTTQITEVLMQAMDHDRYAAQIQYTDTKGRSTVRTVSPIRYSTPETLLAICLGREEPRAFKVQNITRAKLVDANDILAPIEVKDI